jgi:hypothetical protein
MMSDARRRKFKIAAGLAFLISVGAQIVSVDYFDPALFAAEFAVAIWIIAAIGLATARLLPPYVSILVPAGVIVFTALLLVKVAVVSLGAFANGYFIVVIAGPTVSAWLWGFGNRRPRESSRLAAVFE